MDVEDEFVEKFRANGAPSNFWRVNEPSNWVSMAFDWDGGEDYKWKGISDRWKAIVNQPGVHFRTEDEHKDAVKTLKQCEATLTLLSEERPLKLKKIDDVLDVYLKCLAIIKNYEQYIRNTGKETGPEA